jgi:putative oxidoreductase
MAELIRRLDLTLSDIRRIMTATELETKQSGVHMNALAVKLSSYSPAFRSIMRIAVALLFMQHGGQKLFNYPEKPPAVAPANAPAPPPMSDAMKSALHVAGLLEFYGGALMAVGFLTRPTAFVLTGLMAVAYYMGHATNGKGPWPVINGGELALLYCAVFLYFIFAGAGSWSVDQLLFGSKSRTELNFKKSA